MEVNNAMPAESWDTSLETARRRPNVKVRVYFGPIGMESTGQRRGLTGFVVATVDDRGM